MMAFLFKNRFEFAQWVHCGKFYLSILSTCSKCTCERLTWLLLLYALLVFPSLELQAAEYRAAEVTAPRSVDDIDSTLSNVSNQVQFYRGPVIKAVDKWRKSKGPFLRDGHAQFKFRTMDFHTDIIDVVDIQAWAAPGELAYRSGQWRDLFTIGASVYGSYELSGNENAGGSGMLQLNGDNITTLGQAYLEINWKGLIGRVYRQTLDIPYLNKNDSRMIPNTFEAYVLGREGTSLDFLLAYVDKIKLRNSEDFISMGEAAGVEGGGSGTRVIGLIWKPPDTGFDLGATVQRTKDVLQLIYFEANWKRTYKGLGLLIGAQYAHQKGIGRVLAGEFKTNARGVRISGSYRNAVLGFAYTRTDNGAKIKSPFGGRPGYTTSMLRDFDRANEKAWRASLSYHFDVIGLPDWSANIRYTQGKDALSDIAFLPQGDNREVDYTVDYKPDTGRWRGLWFRIRYAQLREEGVGRVAKQFRIILNYSFSIL